MTRAGSGTRDGPGFPGAVVLASSLPAADDRPMLFNTSTGVMSPSPASAPEATATQADSGVGPVADALPVTGPLRGRALIARLEQLAQRELAQLAAQSGLSDPTLPMAMDPAAAGLAWDLGMSGEAVAAAGAAPQLKKTTPENG